MQLLPDSGHANHVVRLQLRGIRKELGWIGAEVDALGRIDRVPVPDEALEGVREGKVGDVAPSRRTGQPGRGGMAHPEDLVVRVHHSLGRPRRAGCIDQRRQVVGLHLVPGIIEGTGLARQLVTPGLQHLVPAQGPAVIVHAGGVNKHHAFEVR